MPESALSHNFLPDFFAQFFAKICCFRNSSFPSSIVCNAGNGSEMCFFLELFPGTELWQLRRERGGRTGLLYYSNMKRKGRRVRDFVRQSNFALSSKKYIKEMFSAYINKSITLNEWVFFSII
jgi:hypothetical protein